VNAPVSDVHLHSAAAQLAPAGGPARDSARYFLHTSPEYAMKRLLAAGSGDIYQICHVVRGYESGRLHNPEFTLIEWYRQGFALPALMDEVEALVRTLLGAGAAAGPNAWLPANLPARWAGSLHRGDPLARAAATAGFAGCGPPRDEYRRPSGWSSAGLGRGALSFICIPGQPGGAGPSGPPPAPRTLSSRRGRTCQRLP
jgi:hypothetical protein